MYLKTAKALLLALSVLLSLSSCQKEETDFSKQETKESTVIEGTVRTSDGAPIAGITVKVDYTESAWLAYAKTRHKAETKTDKYGKYRLHFLIKDDELQTEEEKQDAGRSKLFYLIYDLSSLQAEKYILPADYSVVITSVDPPKAEPQKDKSAIISTSCVFDRATTYTESLYIPRKRMLKVTLKGFVPQQVNGSYDHFEVRNVFPYGMERADEFAFPDTKYERCTIGELFVIYDKAEQTFEVPVALNENNIITLVRKKNGQYTTEEHKVFVTETSPESLSFDY